jgi:hypothetical protein
MKIWKKNDYVYYENGNDKIWIHISELDFKDKGNNQILISARPTWALQGVYEWSGPVSSVLDRYGNSYGSTLEELILNFQNALDVQYNDQTTKAVIVPFNRVTNNTTLTVQPSIDDKTITVNSPTGAAAGSFIVLFHPASERFSTFYATNVAGSVITLDSPIDFAYPVGTYVDIAVTDINVNGSVTPVIYGLRGTGAPPGVDISVDITRILFNCETATAVDLSKFGDIAGGLTNGLLMRTRNNEYQNIFNVKTNGEVAGICYDWTPYSATRVNEGQDGFQARMTFAGPSKVGVAIRLPIGDDLQFIVQDDLSSLSHFHIIAEGHIVEK